MNVPSGSPYYLQIVEQPAKEARFRYLREARTTSSIVGENSDKSHKTFPTITTNYRGRIRLITVLVDKDCRPHPHGLVGPNCKNGISVFETDITDDKCNIVFRQSIGIQCAKKPDVADAMAKRQEELYGDPFRRGYDPSSYDSIDLHEVRLAFVALIADGSGRPRLPIVPVASNVIRDTKASMHLRILHTSTCSGPVTGGSQITLLTETVSQMSTVKLMFYEPSTNWCAYADPLIMHKRVAFLATVPPYHRQNITESALVECFLIRKHEQMSSFDPSVDKSESLTFEYIPRPTRDINLGISCDSTELKHLEEVYLEPKNQEQMEPLSLKIQPPAELPYHLQPHYTTVQPPLIDQPCQIHPLTGQPYQMLPHSTGVQTSLVNSGYPIRQPYQEQLPSTGQSCQKKTHLSTQPPLIHGCPIGQPYQELSPKTGQPYQMLPHPYVVSPSPINSGYPIGQSDQEHATSTGQSYQKRPHISTVQHFVGQPYKILPRPTNQQPQKTLSLQHILLKRKKVYE